MQQKTTRREFLKTGGKIAGTVLFANLSGACMQASGKMGVSKAGVNTQPVTRDSYKIFSQGSIGTMTVKNRLVRSATMVAAADGGRPTEEYIRIHQNIASGGVGVIITGFMIPSQSDARYERQMFVYDDSHIPGLEQVAQAVHDADGKCRLLAQIGHSGETVSPSGIKWPFFWKQKGRSLSSEEVDEIVADFADAVWRVKTAGFDGVELHGAHAYLISSFLSPITNKRIDKYGGSLEKRVHIVRAIMESSRKRVGPDFPIMIKVNSDDNAPAGIQPDDFPVLAAEIAKTGVVALDVSGNDCLQENIEEIEDQAYFFKGAKAADVSLPIMLTGGNRSVEHMEQLLKTKEIDFIGIARPFIREPNLPERWRKGIGDETATCISCNGCFNAIMQGRTAYCTQET